MKNLLYIVLVIASIVACSSEEKIDWTLTKHDPMLVVNGLITSEMKNQEIFLSQTNGYFDTSKVVGVSSALVHVMCNNIDYAFSESLVTPGLYISEKAFAGIPSSEYHLTIQLKTAINGKSEYVATSTMPAGMELDSIMCELYKMPKDLQDDDTKVKDSTIIGVYYYGAEPNTTNDYYLGLLYRNGKPLFSDPRDYIRIRDEYRNGEYAHLEGMNKNCLPGDRIDFKLLSVEKKYWTFIQSIQQMDNSGDPNSMTGPPSNAVGNIENALGYFFAARVSQKSAIVIDKR